MNVLATRPRILKLGPDLAAIVQVRVHHNGRDGRKRQAVGQRVRHGDVHGRVLLVLAEDKVEVLVDDTRHVVRGACVVEGGRRQQRQVRRLPDVGVVQDGREEQVEEHDDGEGVACHPKGRGERRARVRDLRPVDANRQQAQPRVHAEDGVDDLVVRPDPGNERERAGRRPEVVGEPEEHKSEERKVGKEAVPRDGPPVGGRAVLRFVQRAEQHRRRQRRRPDQGGRVDEPAAGQARQPEPNHLRRQQKQEREARAVVLAPVHGADDGHERARGVGRACADVDADDDQGVLLDAERPRVDVERVLAQGQAPAGEHALPGPADGEDEQLGYDVADGKGRVAETEELVGARKDDDEDCG